MHMHPTRGFHPSITALAQEHEQTAAAPTTHFRATNVPHPLKAKPVDQFSEAELASNKCAERPGCAYLKFGSEETSERARFATDCGAGDAGGRSII